MNGNPFAQWVDLGQPRLGSNVVAVSDEFFGAAGRLLQPAEPVFIPDKYDDHGKWMDGWESRRRRGPGHDWCVIELGLAGIVHGVDIDTRFFTGNFPPEASIEACRSEHGCPGEDAGWRTLVAKTSLGANRHHYFGVADTQPVTHLRLNIFPDGGVARLRVYGEVWPDWSRIDTAKAIDLLALEHGGRALACSDQHFGSMHNLNVPGRGANMGDGWETARRRDAGHDWVVLALGAPGVIESVEVDTAHFKGNYPDRVSIETLHLASSPKDPATIAAMQDGWQILLPETGLEADRQHRFENQLRETGVATHVRMNIFPDGGVSRLRLLGRPAK